MKARNGESRARGPGSRRSRSPARDTSDDAPAKRPDATFVTYSADDDGELLDATGLWDAGSDGVDAG